MSTGLAARFASYVVEHPWRVLVLGLLLWAALLPGVARLTPDFTYRNFFHDGDPFRLQFESFETRFGADATTGFVVHSPSGLFDTESATLLRELTDEAWHLPSILRVDSPTNFPWVHAEGEGELVVEDLLGESVVGDPRALAAREAVARSHETLPYTMISADGTTALVVALPQPERDGHVHDPKAITLAARALAGQYDGRGDHEVHLIGQMPLTWAFEEAAQTDTMRLLPFLLLMTVVFLVGALRSVRGAGPPLVTMLLSVVAAMGLMGWMSIHVGNFTALIPQILIAVSLAGAVHLTTNFLEAFRSGRDVPSAARFAIEKNLFPTLVMYCTSAVGFATFMSSPIANMGDLGATGAMGVLAAWVWLQLVLAPMLVLWPWGPVVPSSGRALDEPTERSLAIAHRLQQLRFPLIGGFALLSMIGVGLSTRVEVDSDPWNYFVEGFWCRDGSDFAMEHMEGLVVYELVADAGAPEGAKSPAFLGKVVALQEGMAAFDGVKQSVSIADTVRSINRAFRGDDPDHYVIPASREAVGQELMFYSMSLPQGMDLKRQISVANDAVRISVIADVTGSTEHHRLREQIVQLAEEVGLEVTVTGRHDLYQTMIHYVVVSFVQSLGLAIVLVSLVMGLFLGSLRLAVLAMIPNVVPLMVGGGLLFLLDKPMDIGTLGVGSVVLGIAVDDTVHVLANFHRYVYREGPVRAVAHVFSHTVPALVTTTLMLVAAFGTMAFGIFVPNVWFGIMVAACLAVALLADVTVLPALLLVAYAGVGEGRR